MKYHVIKIDTETNTSETVLGMPYSYELAQKLADTENKLNEDPRYVYAAKQREERDQ